MSLPRAVRVLLVLSVVRLWAASADLQRDEKSVLAIQDSLEAGNLEQASHLLEEALSQRPRDGGLMNLRGVVHARRNEMAEARADFGKAVQLSPELTPAWQNLARACQQTGEAPCAIQAWMQVARAKPSDDEAHQSLSLLYEKQGKFGASLRELNSAKQDNLLLRAVDLGALGRTAEARAVAGKLAKQPDFSEAALDGMADALALPSSAALVIDLVEALDGRGAADVDSLRRLVVAYEQSRRPTDALRTLERIGKRAPNNVADLVEMARLAEDGKNYRDALGYLAHARDLEPNNARIHFLFGLIAGELNLAGEARVSLAKALSIEPENPSFNYAMGTVLLQSRDAGSASAYFQKFLKANPGDSNGHYALGLAYFTSGDYERAKEQMRICEGSRATEGAAQYYLGRIARIEGSLEEATRRLHRSIECLPSFSESHTELARIALHEHDWERARQELAKALRLEPKSFQANEQLLALYRRTHDPGSAKQAELLKNLDEERSKRAELMLRTIEVRP